VRAHHFDPSDIDLTSQLPSRCLRSLTDPAMAPTGNKRRKDQLDAPSVSPIPVTTIQNGRIGQIGSHRTTLEETWKELEGGLKTVFDLEKAFKDPFKLPYMTYYT
jgi:hypothetical protein